MRKYATATTENLVLISASTGAFATSTNWTPVAGDVKISKDGVAAVNTTNLPTFVGMGARGYWRLVLTAAEMTASRVVITVVNSALEDTFIDIVTYGDGVGQIDLRDFADALLKRDWIGMTGEAQRSMLNALRALRNRHNFAGTVYKEDGTTVAWTYAPSTTPTADSITEVTP